MSRPMTIQPAYTGAKRAFALIAVAALSAALLAGCWRSNQSKAERGDGPSIYLPVVITDGTPADAGVQTVAPAPVDVAAPAGAALLPAPPAAIADPQAIIVDPQAVFEPIANELLPIADPIPTVPPLTAAVGGDPFDWEASENYLVLGTDRREDGGSWRTDSIMLVGLDRDNGRAAVFSIPRDLYVSIPGYGYGRINQADYMGERRSPDGGGPELVGGIIQDLFGVRTDHWVRIQMDGFVDFVDALGGVSVYLDCPFSEPIFNLDTQRWEAFRLPAGENMLDGQDAYWFARLRLHESDIGRSRRQRALIWAMRDRILSTNAISRLPQLYTAFRETIDTDLGLFEIVSLAKFATGIDAANVRAGGLTLRDLQNYVTPGGAQVLVIGSEEHVRSLVTNIWDEPAMADAYRAEAAGCEAPAPIEATAAIAAESVDQSLAAAAAVTQQPFANIIAPGLDGTATVETITTLPDVSGAPLAMTTQGSVLLPPLFNPATDQDPRSGVVYDPITGFPFDPHTGLPADPVTGGPVDVETLPPMGS